MHSVKITLVFPTGPPISGWLVDYMDRFDEAFYVAALLFCLSSGVDILSGLMVDRNNQYLPLSGETGGGNCETNQE